MNMQILVLFIILATFASSVLISFFITVILQDSMISNTTPSPSIRNKIDDNRGDAKLVALYRTKQTPEVRNYHDILSADIKKINDNKILLTIDLAGDANQNEKYETVYLWLINHIDPLDGKEKLYTIIVPNFALDSNFENKGWYLAIYNNTANSYSLPLSKINSNMPKNKVEVFFDLNFIGNLTSFNYSVSVMIRVNSTFLAKPPDYLVDSCPDNDLFWSKWFRS